MIRHKRSILDSRAVNRIGTGMGCFGASLEEIACAAQAANSHKKSARPVMSSLASALVINAAPNENTPMMCWSLDRKVSKCFAALIDSSRVVRGDGGTCPFGW